MLPCSKDSLEWRWFAALFLAVLGDVYVPRTSFAQQFITRTKVPVQQATRIDWTIPVTGHSVAEPSQLMSGYNPTSQRYDFAGPIRADQPMPLVIFISYRSTPMGFERIGNFCIRNRIIFVEPWKVGNSVPVEERIRITLDCLGDVRRRLPIDPDRTYIAGYSGGASVAQMIARALPEYFGGVLTANTSYGPPTEPWALDRARNRLSYAMIVGENEAAGYEMSKVQLPIFRGMGIPTQCDVRPRAGHVAPPASNFIAALKWLETGTRRRKDLANKRPALRITGSPTREAWAQAALEDCQELLKQNDKVHIALGILKDLQERWPDLPQANQAQEIWDEYDQKDEKPWRQIAKKERLARTQLLATTYDQAAVSKVNKLAKMPRGVYAKAALDNYQVLIVESDDSSVISHAKTRLSPLLKLASNAKTQLDWTRQTTHVAADASQVSDLVEIPVGILFNMDTTVRISALLELLEARIGQDKPRFVIDEEGIEKAGLSLHERVRLNSKNAMLHEVLYSALTPCGLEYVYADETITIQATSK